MWESHGFSECANSNVLVASDGTGGSRDTPTCLRKVALGVATFSLHVLSGTSFEVQRIGFWGGQVPGRHTVPRAECWGAIQALSRVDVKTKIHLPMDAKHVAKGVTQRDDIEYGPNGDPWSILFRLIDGRSGKTEVIKVKSHKENVGPSAIQQDKIAFHHMRGEIPWRMSWPRRQRNVLQPDMNFDQKAKRAERTGVSVAKRLALVQADIWGCWNLLRYRPSLLLRNWLERSPTKVIYS